MPVVRLTGTVKSKDDASRRIRARLLYKLFLNGWDIYNGNGDQSISLSNIEKKIVESDAFVFTPNPTLQDLFNFASIFVGFQTLDDNLKDKPAVILNDDGSWDGFLDLMDHLHGLGTIGQKYGAFISVAETTKKVISLINYSNLEKHNHIHAEHPDIIDAGIIYSEKKIPMPDFNVCVFCSASIKKEDYLLEGYNLGKDLANKGWGCISGAGKTGIMGSVVRGAYENGGWSGGSNVPHIIKLEGLPEGLNEFWPRGDIYTRMEVMIEKSDAFVIMPGGMGTIQEVLALCVLKEQGGDILRDKPIVIFNKQTEGNGGFWDPLIKILNDHDHGALVKVVTKPEDILPAIKG